MIGSEVEGSVAKKYMNGRDNCLSGVRSEPSNGLPVWKRMLDLVLILALFQKTL